MITSAVSYIDAAEKLGLSDIVAYTSSVRIIDKLCDKHSIRLMSKGCLKPEEKKQRHTDAICGICGDDFKFVRKPGRKDQLFCSTKCRGVKMSGKNHHNYKGTLYTVICFEHHKKECIICGENRVVATHHYNEDHSDNRPENLVPLCPTHHQYMHSRFKDIISAQVDAYVTEFIKSQSQSHKILCGGSTGALIARDDENGARRTTLL